MLNVNKLFFSFFNKISLISEKFKLDYHDNTLLKIKFPQYSISQSKERRNFRNLILQRLKLNLVSIQKIPCYLLSQPNPRSGVVLNYRSDYLFSQMGNYTFFFVNEM